MSTMALQAVINMKVEDLKAERWYQATVLYYVLRYYLCKYKLFIPIYISAFWWLSIVRKKTETQKPKYNQFCVRFHPYLAPRLVLAPQLLINSVSEAHGGDPPWLSDHHITLLCFLLFFSQHLLQDELGNLGAFSAARLSRNDHHAVAP